MAKPLSCRIRPSPIQEWREICFSGSVVTKGGLLFTGRADGRLTALDKATGEKLWAFMTAKKK
ncbi:MAG: hypothetical protein ACXU82_04435 [Caulobacteraceae bacterium]